MGGSGGGGTGKAAPIRLARRRGCTVLRFHIRHGTGNPIIGREDVTIPRPPTPDPGAAGADDRIGGRPSYDTVPGGVRDGAARSLRRSRRAPPCVGPPLLPSKNLPMRAVPVVLPFRTMGVVSEKAWAGTCRQLVVRLADGTDHRANYQFTKYRPLPPPPPPMSRHATLRALVPVAALLAAGACADPALLPTTPAAPGAPQRAVTTPSYEEALATAADGAVIDADRDGTGDGTSAPNIVLAINDATNGTQYVHLEWDISALTRPVVSGRVRLTTIRNSLSILETAFYAASGDGDGLLTPSDFNAAVSGIGTALPAPDSWDEATYYLGVTDALNAAIAAHRHYFVLQGRVPEGYEGGGVGIRTSSPYNSADTRPALMVLRPTNTAPTIATPPTAASAVEGSTARFSAAATDPDNDPLTYTWSFGDGTTATGSAVSHVYADNGSYTVIVVASDGSLSDTARTTATITNAPPVVTAAATGTAAPKTAYALQASVRDAGALDGPWVSTVTWGDGSPATSVQQTAQGAIAASHAFDKKGTYTVTITVRDKDGGSGTARTLVTVAQPTGKR